MVGLLRDVMGLRVEFDEPGTAELSTCGGDRVQVFGPGHRYFEFFGDHAVGEPAHDDTWEWIHMRAPEGNLYELAGRRDGGGT